MENENEKTERLKLSSRRSSGLFDIDSNWISTNNSFLDFDSCKFTLVHNQHQELNIVKNDFSSGYSSSFDIDIANNRVSEDFIKLLDKNYSKRKLSIFNTDYKELGTGYESMKICIVSPNKIGLYRDYDLIILERKVNHK